MSTMKLEDLMANYVPGSYSGWTWQQESDELWSTESDYMDMLATSIQKDGVKMPVLLGDDGRVWGGHHRIVVCWSLGFEEIPITHA